MNTPVREGTMPREVQSLSTLAHVDYTDYFVAETPRAQELTAEDWARRVLEKAPASFRVGAPTTWFTLGLKHGVPWSADNILGWPVRRSDPDLLLLGADGRLGASAELILTRAEDSISFGTLLELGNPVMSRIWSAMEAPHRRVVASLLRRGVRA